MGPHKYQTPYWSQEESLGANYWSKPNVKQYASAFRETPCSSEAGGRLKRPFWDGRRIYSAEPFDPTLQRDESKGHLQPDLATLVEVSTDKEIHVRLGSRNFIT